MKNLLLTLFAVLFFSSAQAQLVDISGVADRDKVRILQASGVKVAEPPASASVAPPPTPPKSAETIQVVKEWGQLGQAVGTGIIAAAKELGMAANEFAGTDLGKITIGILVYKYIGREIISGVVHYVTTIGLLLASFWFSYKLLRTAAWTEVTSDTKNVPYFFGLFTRKRLVKSVTKRAERLTDSMQTQQAAAYIIGIISMIIFAFKF